MGWSPYHYCGNNPVSYRDNNGKNAVKIIDGDNRTITIKAVYIVDPNAYNDDVITSIQNELNNKKYNVSEGQYSGYSVQFNLTPVMDNSQTTGEYESTSNYNEGGFNIGNTITSRGEYHVFPFTKPDGSVETRSFAKSSNGSQFGGYCAGNDDIVMNAAIDTMRNRIHEMFHTFFFNRDGASKGIGSYLRRNDMPNQEDINILINNDKLPAVQLPSK